MGGTSEIYHNHFIMIFCPNLFPYISYKIFMIRPFPLVQAGLFDENTLEKTEIHELMHIIIIIFA